MRKDIERRIKKYQREYDEIDEKISALHTHQRTISAVITELEHVLKTLPKEAGAQSAKKELRFGTDVYKAREVLKKIGEPLHISLILEHMGETNTKERRSSLSSQIAAYVRGGDVFIKTAPNTFGLQDYGTPDNDNFPPVSTVNPYVQEEDQIPF